MAKKKLVCPCPCGRGVEQAACCGRFLAGLPAPSPESLMRARYTAYTLADEGYLLRTWHVSTRPPRLDLGEPPLPKWIGLEVRAAELQDADHGTVSFVARYRVGGRAGRLEEVSRFVREGDCWYYLDGEVRED